MASDWYTASGWPATNAPGASSPARAEFVLIQTAMTKLPAITGATVGAAVVINGSGAALTTTTGALALAGNLTTTGAFNTTFAQQATATFTLPAATDTLVGRASTDTLTNKTISGSSNTLSNIGNSSLTNSGITIGSTAVSLGGTAATIAGLTLTAPALGTPTSGTLTNCTGLPVTTGISGLGSGVATLLGGASSGTGGPAGTAAPVFTGTITAAAANFSGTITAAAANFSGTITAAASNTISGTQAFTSGQTLTLFNIANAGIGGGTAGIGYIVFIGVGGPAQNYAIISCSGGACSLVASSSNGSVSFSMSGNNFQMTNSNGGGNQATWVAKRFSL